MEIKGKVYCFFEQSGTFKNEFIQLGIPAEDYDIQNNFGETDHVIDLFAEIEKAYAGTQSIFDTITQDDLIIAFFPCIYFCDNNALYFTGEHINFKHWKLTQEQIVDKVIERAKIREYFYELALKLFAIGCRMNLRLVFENPYSITHYLHNNFPFNPAIIDKNRTIRGDYYTKPTQYYFLNCEPTHGLTIQNDKPHKTICELTGRSRQSGLCSEERSMISPDYARNFICDFIIGKMQSNSQTAIQFDYEEHNEKQFRH